MYFVSSSYTKCLIYASPKKEATGAWTSINIVYKDDHWYYNPKKSIGVYSLPGNTIEEENENWKNIVEAWFENKDTVMIE